MSDSTSNADARLPDVLIVARANNYGLSRDAAILEQALAEAGLRIERASTRQRTPMESLRRLRRARVILHIERVHVRWLRAADTNWLVPNQERFPGRHLRRLARIDRVLAKTRHAEAIFTQAGAKETTYLGFTSEDRRDRSIPKDWGRFFHMAGGNTLKGTQDLVGLWATHPEWPELVLLQKAESAPRTVPANVTLHSTYLEDCALRSLQNQCGIHLCPSRSEGWGHHILEAMSTGAVVVTTDAPPMNEHITADAGILVPAERSAPRHLGRQFFVDRKGLEIAIERLLAMSPDQKALQGAAARKQYERIDRSFRERLRDIVDVLEPETGT